MVTIIKKQLQVLTLAFKISVLALLFFCGVYNLSFAQQFRFGLAYSTELNENSTQFVNNNYIANLNNQNAGISIERVWRNNFSINTGIYYSQYKFDATLPIYLANFVDMDNCIECNYYVLPKEYKTTYVEVPLTTRYYFLNKQLLAFAEAGIINNFLLSGTYMDEKNYFLNGVGGLGVGIKLMHNWYLESSLKYSNQITTIYEEESYKNKLLRLEFGLKREF
ncbi:outer membrane beta-barrel protein [Chondrinema litorale]|uniref:outer membrane beta-barrel protein n=1 Tax=Chondrinema litorale TaxID=2994555 RepID=UPI00254361D7|nr:outer membrane beta-barrel protein [Chondrinema litorale]UZR98586.1 hypothetical protein OQ292_32680 [Chondrinema litorale]